jgi:hypothetical protein
MTPLIKESERTPEEWQRKCRDAVNALAKLLTQQGATTARPPAPVVGQMFYDTTLGKPIWRHSTGVWKDAAGTTV